MAKNNRPERDSRAPRRNEAPRAAQPHTNHASGGIAAHPADQHQDAQQGSQHQGAQPQGAQQQAAATAVVAGTTQREHAAPAPTSMKAKKGNQPKHSPKR
ncbi:hypothetical protein QEZ54_30380 [Catellatospora sp. KI3]|uniref:hypothetical protein n=1 Tax=Catellatospora sp. KI3 TaxID=3041620 RepID=UPI002482CE73|nr:hypothetical protein [Catellatospora sp. KI3]MDI1465282.1 hypothetical protein [Catellatospora sp. KI3]